MFMVIKTCVSLPKRPCQSREAPSICRKTVVREHGQYVNRFDLAYLHAKLEVRNALKKRRALLRESIDCGSRLAAGTDKNCK